MTAPRAFKDAYAASVPPPVGVSSTSSFHPISPAIDCTCRATARPLSVGLSGGRPRTTSMLTSVSGTRWFLIRCCMTRSTASKSTSCWARISAVAVAFEGIMLATLPAWASVQLTLSPVAGSDRSRICRIWWESSTSALRPKSGFAPECEARPLTVSVARAMLDVARRT